MSRFISSTRVEVLGAHAHVRVWVRGQRAGVLVVGEEQVDELLDVLDPERQVTEGCSKRAVELPVRGTCERFTEVSP